MAGQKKSILVVEDNIIAANIVKMLFESLGCKVHHVTDGKDAVNEALQNTYDGICIDIGLPTMSGVEACKEIRAHETKNNLKKVPIIAVTGNNSSEEIAAYIKAGMQAVIDKPFTKEKAEYFLTFC